MLCFEPLTGAIGLFLVENAVRTQQVIPHGCSLLRRQRETMLDVAVNEAAEPLIDQVLNTGDLKVMGLLLLLLLWQRVPVFLALTGVYQEGSPCSGRFCRFCLTRTPLEGLPRGPRRPAPPFPPRPSTGCPPTSACPPGPPCR